MQADSLYICGLIHSHDQQRYRRMEVLQLTVNVRQKNTYLVMTRLTVIPSGLYTYKQCECDIYCTKRHLIMHTQCLHPPATSILTTTTSGMKKSSIVSRSVGLEYLPVPFLSSQFRIRTQSPVSSLISSNRQRNATQRNAM